MITGILITDKSIRKATKTAADILGEEELESLKNDLITPVRTAAREAVEDMLGSLDDGDNEEGDEE